MLISSHIPSGKIEVKREGDVLIVEFPQAGGAADLTLYLTAGDATKLYKELHRELGEDS